MKEYKFSTKKMNWEREGVGGRPEKVTDEALKKYIEKHKDASVEKIAAHFDCSSKTIQRRTHKLGYKLKKIWVMG